jgi:esterase/lipase superfamily enzyme
MRIAGLGLCLAVLMLTACSQSPKKLEAPKPPAPAPEASAPPPPAAEPPAPGAAAPQEEADTKHEYKLDEPSGGGAPPAADGVPAKPRLGTPRSLEAPQVGSKAPPASAPDNEPSAAAPPPAPAPVGSAAPPPLPKDWDVVPVYYGTDRGQVANVKRLDYGSARARKLELGRALVTVPKTHQVPAIERPWVVKIPYLNVTVYEQAEDPKSHFTMQELKTLSEADFLTLVRERLAKSATYKDHAFIFVHGYNTSFDYAIYRTAQIAYDLKFDGAAFAYSWPSGGGLASYTYDRESSGQSEPFLKEFMELVVNKTGAKSVSVIAHSMGNQPTLQVLKDLRRAKPDSVQISQIILAAPDVDRDNFENIAAEIQGLANGVTLYAAANDRALQVSRNFYGGIPRAGDVPATGPLVLSGIDTIDVTTASTDSLSLNHSGYAENNALLDDIGRLILNGIRPPNVRTPTLEEIATAKGAYWRYKPALP